MSVQAFDRLATALQEIRPRFGAGAFSDRRRVIGLLADKAPDAKREIRVVGTAIDEGIPASLARTERQLVGVEMDRLANGLEASTGLRLDMARQVVRAFAFAMDLGPLPSVYEAAGTPAPVMPPPAPVSVPTGGWSGMTAPVQTTPPGAPISQYPPHSQHTQNYQTGGSAPMGFATMPAAKKPNMAGRIALGVGGVIVLAFGVSQMMGGGGGGNSQAGNNVVASSGETGFAGELVDQGIAAQAELNPNLGAPTPMSITVGQRVTTTELQRMIQEDPQLILVDVLASQHPQTIRGAYWLPSGGTAGSFQDSYQSDFAAGLGQVTGGVNSRPVVFFCAGANCWESYNATLRANAAGFTRLFWYRGGLAAWGEARGAMAPVPSQGAAGQGEQQPPIDDQQPIDQQQQQQQQPGDQIDPSITPGDKPPVN